MKKYTVSKLCLECGKSFKLDWPRQKYCHDHRGKSKNIRHRRGLKNRVFTLLGDRCSSSDCQWVNQDGSKGCSDRRCLQVDHVLGGGCQERKCSGMKNTMAVYYDVLQHPEKYQLLCANCNWIKRFVNNEIVVKI